MDKSNHITRRTALVGALVSSATLALPMAAFAARGTPSPIAAMIARHDAAMIELKAANAAADPLFDALWAENAANPIMVEFPGFRFNHGRRSITGTSPHAIREFYEQHYGMLSGKGGGRVAPDGRSFVCIDYSADQARDLDLALANYEAARGVLVERQEQIGLPVAQDRVDEACTELENAWLALLSYVPVTLEEVREKAAAVLAVAASDPVQLDNEHTEVFLQSLAGVRG